MSVTDGDRPHEVALLCRALRRLRALLAIAGLLIGTLASLGCYSVPPGKSGVSTVTIEGADSVDKSDLAERITTREASRFVGFIYDVELFDRYALRRDLARIERCMRARGFYDAIVREARVVTIGNKVHVTIEVEEGRPVLVDTVEVDGEDALPTKIRDAVRSAIASVLPKDARLDEDKLEAAEKAAVKALTANGYAGARAERKGEVDLAAATARLRFTVFPGRSAKVSALRFTGLDELPLAKVRHVFGIEEGDDYSSQEVDEARQALLDLGVFSSVEVALDTKELESGGLVALDVSCEVSKLRALLLGGGLQFDSLKTDVHAVIGWQSSNFLGGLRRFEIRWKPGIVLYPTRFPDVQAPEKLLFEEKLVASLRQPAFVESRTTGLARAEYNIYPVLLPGATTQNVLGYHEVRGTVGVERQFFGGKLFVSPQYGAQGNVPFDYIGKTPDAQPLILSYVDIFTNLDFRDDPIHTRKGFYLGNQLQIAGGLLQGDATDVRTQPEVRVYVPISKRVVFAVRSSVGFLIPVDYGGYADVNFRNPGSSRVEGSARDYQILFFRGFFAGGPVSNRGYPLRGIGPYDLIPYLSPAGQSITSASCNPNDSGCTLPTGGRTLWEASAEVRIVVAGPVSTAVFCDAADVSPFGFDIRLDRPHLSCGAGARYDTPVGPIRLDIGYRVPGAQFPKGAAFERPPDNFLGLPIALAFGIGEAF